MLPLRRNFLKFAIASAAGASMGMWPSFRSAHAQLGARETRRLRDGFYVLTVGPTNVLAVTGPDGIALVDGVSARDSAALMDMVAALPAAGRVHTLFNTHWHPDHTGLNESLGRAGAAIIAHENTRLWLTTDVTWPWSGETVQPLAEIARPNKTFYVSQELTVGDRHVQCGYLRDCPHTDGDIYVFFPESNVLAVGDAVYGDGWPFLDWWTGGWIGGHVGGLEALLQIADAETLIVPAHGPVLSHTEVQAQYEMYSVIYERLARLLYSGRSPDESVEARPTAEFDERMGRSDEFVRQAMQSTWAYLSPDA